MERIASIEIPLLREANAYVLRLQAAAKAFNDSRYSYHRRLNWSHRFSEAFYSREAWCFLNGPEEYLEGRGQSEPHLSDVYSQRVASSVVLSTLAKVLAHWLFRLLRRRPQPGAYRKCYVDVDDRDPGGRPPDMPLTRAVFPFPLGFRRQWKYVTALRRERQPFVLDGNPYLLADVLRFVSKRDIQSMMRLESRAHILHALNLVSAGMSRVEVSDEFNLGSLDFCRTLSRYGVHTVNSAHGVGKYLPAHAFSEFHVLTQKQREYYTPVRPCNYSIRQREDLAEFASNRPSRVVYLSQTFPGVNSIVRQREEAALALLGRALVGTGGIALYFKPHPTEEHRGPPLGFRLLSDLAEVNGKWGTIFLSQFSTCQIDPQFRGRKILIESEMIRPAIVFDEEEEIMTLDEFISSVVGSA